MSERSGATGARLQIRTLDVILVILVLAAAITSGIRIYGSAGDALRLVIEAPSGSWIYDLGIDRTVSIPGALGDTIVRIENDTARITDSPCPNKTCIAAPPISRRGEWNACLPNKVILRVEGNGKKSGGLDAVGY